MQVIIMNKLKTEEMKKQIVSFTRKKQYGFDSDTVKNLFIKKKRDGKQYHPNSFMYNIIHTGADTGYVDEDGYEDAIRTTVRSYTNNKESAIILFKRFDAYVRNKTGMEFHVHYPPIPLNSTFERLMFISKYIQDQKAQISALEDILWVSSRTIETDIRKLRGMDEDPIQICGKQYILPEMIRENDRISSMPSTVHPLFLTCNLTEVIITLEGLKVMAENPALKGYALKTAGDIWEQLSDIARDRILYVVSELMISDKDWYLSLGKHGDHSFWPEKYVSRFGHNCMLDCLKNDKPCYIEYLDEDGETKIIHVDQVTKYVDHRFTIRIGDQTLKLDGNRIIRSTLTIEEIM